MLLWNELPKKRFVDVAGIDGEPDIKLLDPPSSDFGAASCWNVGLSGFPTAGFVKEKFVAVVICPPILFWKERPKKGFVSIIDGTPSLLSGTPAKIKFVVVAICEPILLWNTLAKKRFVPVVDGAPSLLSGTPAKVKFVDAAICELMLRWKELPGIEFVAVAAGVDGAPIVPGLGLVKGKFVVDAVVCAPTGAAKIPDAKNKTHVFISL